MKYSFSLLFYLPMSFMRRLPVILLLCFLSVLCNAQSAIPQFHAFGEKYYYIDTNRFFHDSPLVKTRDTINKLKKMAEDAGDNEFSYGLMLFEYIKEYREHLVSSDTTERRLLQLATYANENNMPHLEADVLQAIGDFYSDNPQQQSAAVEYYISAYGIYHAFKPDEYPQRQAYTYMLGGMFYRYEDYNNSIRYMQEAIALEQSTGNNIYCSIANTIGLAYRQLKIYDSAIVYFELTYRNAVRLNSKVWMGIARGNTGITYFYQHKYIEAIPLLQQDIETSMSMNIVKNAVGSMAILATIYNVQHQYDKAQKILEEALIQAENKRFWIDYQLADKLYTQMYIVYMARKDYAKACLYADSALMAKDSVMDRNNLVILSKAHEKENFIQHKREAEKMRNQLNIGKLELAKQRIEITFTFIGIVILLLVILFIARERKRSENLLLNILPEKIADRLKRKEHPIADYFDHASIIFIDMAGFTIFSDGRDPKEIVNILNHVFTCFDNIAERHGLEKIKTIGDCYMAVSGLPDLRPDHAEAAAQMALDIRSEMKGYKANDGTPIEFRIGLDCGPVVAGVIGRRKFIYDLWGDTVNTASRMESTGLAGEIHCTDRFKKMIEGKHTFKNRGQTDIKGKGMMDTWLIID